VTNLLHKYEQLGLISLKDNNGVITLVEIARGHPLFRCPSSSSDAHPYQNASIFENKACDIVKQRISENGYKIADAESFRNSVLSSDNSSSLDDVNRSSAARSKNIDAPIKKDHKTNIRVVELFRPSRPFRETFGPVTGEFGECLTAAEVIFQHFVIVFNFV
jgi:hypothetical protein